MDLPPLSNHDLAAHRRGTSPDPPRGRRVVRRMRRLLFGLLAATMLLIGTGLIYQTIAESRDRRAFPPPGRMVDVGGYQLHLQTTGAGGGGPVVLLDSAFASASPQWGWIQPELARDMHVVSIDRPGMGWSDPAPGPPDARRYVEDLHTALQQIGAVGPYVVVAHSMGSLTTRAFAMRTLRRLPGWCWSIRATWISSPFHVR